MLTKTIAIIVALGLAVLGIMVGADLYAHRHETVAHVMVLVCGSVFLAVLAACTVAPKAHN